MGWLVDLAATCILLRGVLSYLLISCCWGTKHSGDKIFEVKGVHYVEVVPSSSMCTNVFHIMMSSLPKFLKLLCLRIENQRK